MQEDNQPLVTIVTNTYQKYHRQNVAVDSWVHLRSLFPKQLHIINFQFLGDHDFSDYYNQIQTSFYLERSSQTLEPHSIKKLPVLYDIIEAGFNMSNSEYVMYTNSDVILLPRIIEYIIKETPDCMACPRLDIQNVDSFQDILDSKVTPVRHEIAGYDVFCFQRQWWERNKQYFNHAFVIGKPLFDVDFAGLMVLFGNKYYIGNSFPAMALHIHHGTDSVTTDCPEKTWNEDIHKNNPLLQIANNVMFYNLQHNLCKRKPWGAFLQPQKNEREFQDTFFDCINIHKDNTIKYIE